MLRTISFGHVDVATLVGWTVGLAEGAWVMLGTDVGEKEMVGCIEMVGAGVGGSVTAVGTEVKSGEGAVGPNVVRIET
jgi:hypothetical protein